MPCFLTVSINLKDPNMARKAAAELGLMEGADYQISGNRFVVRKTAQESASQTLGKVRQRYGVLEAEARARRKGYSARRQTQDDGTITVTLRN